MVSFGLMPTCVTPGSGPSTAGALTLRCSWLAERVTCPDKERNSVEILLTNEDWNLIRQSLIATIRHREVTSDYLDDDDFRSAQVEAARETLRRVDALHEQLREEGYI